MAAPPTSLKGIVEHHFRLFPNIYIHTQKHKDTHIARNIHHTEGVCVCVYSKTNNANLVYLWYNFRQTKNVDKIRNIRPDYITQLSVQNMLLHAENKHVNGLLSFFALICVCVLNETLLCTFFCTLPAHLFSSASHFHIFIFLCHLIQSKQTRSRTVLFIFDWSNAENAYDCCCLLFICSKSPFHSH